MSKFYRFEDTLYAVLDHHDEFAGWQLVVRVFSYPVIKTTPKGVWLDTGLGDKRFVLLSANKRFACPTIDEARESFVARKRAQIRIYDAKIARAEEAIKKAMAVKG